MRVLQAHNLAVRPEGGAKFIVENEAALLRSAGCEVEQFFVHSAQTKEISKLRTGLKAIWNLEAVKDLVSQIERFRPEVLHVHTPFPLMSPAVFRAAARRQVPVVVSNHSFRMSCVSVTLFRDRHVCELCVGRRIKVPAVRYRCYHSSAAASSALVASLALHRALGTLHDDVDIYIAPSEFAARKLVEEGLPAEKVVVKPNSAPPISGETDTREEFILFMGRLEVEKGVHTLLEAWRQMADPPQLVVLGKGTLEPLVKEAAATNPRVTFGGWADQDGVARYLSRARYMILPSEWYEGHPIAGVQALAAGTPLIASDVGNFTEMAEPGVTGYRFRSGDPQAVASVVQSAWSDRGRWVELSRGARRLYREQFSQGRNLAGLLSVYRRAMEFRRPSFASSDDRIGA
jgi:glycosyltransferase involved in cell wall biosynthesis